MNHSTVVAGVDVSKTHLDIAFWPTGQAHRVANTAKGIKQLQKLMRTAGVDRAVYEPTGPYHRAMERSLHSAGWPLVRVHPGRARRFAEATGALAKTDRIDALCLAKMATALDLLPTPIQSPNLQRLKDLVAARQALTNLHIAEQNRLKSSEDPFWRTAVIR